jgi:serine/threonine-protein phosphatase 5
VRAFKFGQDITETFLARNGLTWMIRSHEWCELGFQWCHDNQCCTLFSAPNYCNRNRNLGAVVVFEAEDSMMPQPRNFAAAHYPNPR